MRSEFTWNACRVCLHDGNLQSIFENDENGLVIRDKLIQCGDITINDECNLPDKICPGCRLQLDSAFIFRMQCKQSERILSQIYTKDGQIDKNLLDAKGFNIMVTLVEADDNGTEPSETISKDGDDFKDENEDFLELEEEVENDIEYDDCSFKKDVSVTADEIDNFNDRIEDFLEEEENNSQYELDSEDCPSLLDKADTVCTDDDYIIHLNSEDLLDEDNDSQCAINSIVEKNQKKSKRTKISGVEKITKSTMAVSRKLGRKKSQSVHICEVCGNTYNYKSTLNTHMRRHTKEKPYSCEICGRSFSVNGRLTCHMRTHTGQKPYECRFCKRKFADVGARQVHERTHTGERPYKCEICDKTFTHASVLQKHKLMHTGEKPFSCELCRKQFRFRYHLTAHLATIRHQEKSGEIKSF